MTVIFMISATSGNTGTECLGKHMVKLTECLVTNAVKPHAATDTVSNHPKITNAKHYGPPCGSGCNYLPPS